MELVNHSFGEYVKGSPQLKFQATTISNDFLPREQWFGGKGLLRVNSSWVDEGLYATSVHTLGNKYSRKGEPYMIRRSEGDERKSWGDGVHISTVYRRWHAYILCS
jgi:hypothetical protein